MKKVKNIAMRTIEGFPLKVPERDSEGTSIKQADGTFQMKQGKLDEVVRLFVFNIPHDKLTMEDSIRAHDLMTQMSSATDGLLPVEDAEHKWLRTKLEELGPKTWLGVDSFMVKEALDDFERLHEPKEKDKEP